MDSWNGEPYDDDDGSWDPWDYNYQAEAQAIIDAADASERSKMREPRKRDLSGNIIDGAYADGKTKVTTAHPRDSQGARIEQLEMQIAGLQAAGDEVQAINRMLRSTIALLKDRNADLENTIAILREIHSG